MILIWLSSCVIDKKRNVRYIAIYWIFYVQFPRALVTLNNRPINIYVVVYDSTNQTLFITLIPRSVVLRPPVIVSHDA